MAEEKDGPSNRAEFSDLLFRVVASSALVLGVGSGGYTLSTADDRYRAAEARKDLQIRDVRINALEKRVDLLDQIVDRIDRTGPAVGNRDFAITLKELDRRIDQIEKAK